MELLINSLIILVVFTIPFIVIATLKNRFRKKLQVAVDRLLQERNTTSATQEILGKMAIAVDDRAQWFIYVKQHPETQDVKIIPLANTRSCQLIKQSRTISTDRESYQLIDSLSIRFAFHSKTPDEEIELFNLEQDLSLNGELDLGERWVVLLNNLLKGTKGH